jgi:cellulose synthase/poly-beta-1,6-N-acetylglucosamine synthase-like glycosyltransferase
MIEGLAVILFLISAVCVFLLLYPYIVYPVLLARAPRQAIVPGEWNTTVSLLFCAFNESGSLDSKLQNLERLKARRPDLEILVYDDVSDDDTAHRLAERPDLVVLVRGEERSGKAAGMKRLAALANGEILVFTDANVLCAPDAIDRLLSYYVDPEIGGVCGTLLYEKGHLSPTAEIGADYWRLDERLRTLESETGNVMGGDGSIFSIRRALYPQFPDTVLDDFAVSMSVVFAGKRLVKAPDVLAYENSISSRSEEWRRKMRIGARAYHTHAWMRPQLRRMKRLDRFKYVSRKMLRWFGGAFLAIGTITALAALALVSLPAFVLALAGGGIGLAIILRIKSGRLAKVGEILLAMMATLIGVLQGMRGYTVVIWSPASSR